jgi:DNA-binding MarR family transcriptional regulator
LTDSGRSEIEARRDRKRERWERALADVDAEELQAATRVLTRLSAVFDED